VRFDFAHIAVPFRMQPGLHRLAQGARHLSALDPASALFLEKQRVSAIGRALFCHDGFDADAAFASILAQARRDGIALPQGRPALELLLEQDLALLDLASAGVPWMCVCVPSGWAPEEKIGRSLAAIHTPVADGATLAAGWPHLARLLTSGGEWERHVWSISPSPRYDQHPQRRAPPVWPAGDDLEAFASQCYLRSERQTFFPVREGDGQPTRQAVFTITPAIEPLSKAVRDASHAHRLHQALASMSEGVLAYKNLDLARAPLLAWLERRRREEAPPPGAQPV